MLNQGTSMHSFRQRAGASAKTITLFVIGLCLMLLLAAWTASHNVPMLMRGTVEIFRVLGGAAALAGEALLLVCYILPFFTAGRQRTATMIVGIWTFLMLLFNSVVGYAQLAANDKTVNQMVDFYGGYIAPFPLFITVFFGLLIILETSEEIRARNAEAAARIAEQKRRTDMALWAQEQTDTMLETLPEVHQALQAGAVLTALEEAKQVFKKTTGREPTDAEISQALALVQNRQVHVPNFQPPAPIGSVTGNGNGHKQKTIFPNS